MPLLLLLFTCTAVAMDEDNERLLFGEDDAATVEPEAAAEEVAPAEDAECYLNPNLRAHRQSAKAVAGKGPFATYRMRYHEAFWLVGKMAQCLLARRWA